MGAEDSTGAPDPPRIRRHLDGWQLGLLAVALPALALWLALPRPVAPRRLPLPEVDRAELVLIRAVETGRARGATEVPLSFAVRRVGEGLRQYGRANTRSDANRLKADVRRHFQSARRAKETEGLLQLRALQTELFLRAVQGFENDSAAERELTELSGSFVASARRSGWFTEGRKLVFSEAELFAMYRIRWTELVDALDITEFRPTLQELRIYYRALLEHPEGMNRMEQESRRLAYVRALEKRDTEYPAALARGVLHYRLGQRAAAASAFMEHLAANPDGAYALLAQNYLLAALAGGAFAE